MAVSPRPPSNHKAMAVSPRSPSKHKAMAVSPRPPSKHKAMIVSPRSPSKHKATATSPRPPTKQKPTPSKTHSKDNEKQLSPLPVQQSHGGNGPPDLGTSCHQCRQKTQNFSASCTNVNRRPCRIKVCHTCLQNRYGESAVDVEASGDWKCPKCRGICNCSLCMKKKGQEPTGILAPMAKSGGFSSVSELLQVQGNKIIPTESRRVKLPVSPEKTNKIGQLPIKRKAADENKHPNSVSEAVQTDKKVSKETVKKTTKRKLEVETNGKLDDSRKNGIDEKAANSSSHIQKKKMGDTKEELELHCKQSRDWKDGENAAMSNSFAKDKLENQSAGVDIKKPPGKCAMQGHPSLGIQTGTANIEFPKGQPLMTVVGIEVSFEDVGLVFQFLEFCTTFMKFLDLHKGQAVSILRDLICGRGRLGRHSSSIQFQVKLLSMLKQQTGADGQLWLKALQKCFSESQFARKDLPSEFFKGSNGYEKLSSSEKLRILLFLCDEILDTEELRTWIDNENGNFSERHKEAKEKLLAAKEKEKSLLKKLNAVAQPNSSPRSRSVEGNILKIKTEMDKARSEKQEALRGVNASKQYSDAVRTKPLYTDGKGRYFWNLTNCSANGPPMLIQDAKVLDMTTPEDNWFFYDDEQAKKAEKIISICKKKVRVYQIKERPCPALVSNGCPQF